MDFSLRSMRMGNQFSPWSQVVAWARVVVLELETGGQREESRLSSWCGLWEWCVCVCVLTLGVHREVKDEAQVFAGWENGGAIEFHFQFSSSP